MRARVVKNKVAPPFRSAEFDIMFNRGISLEGDLVDLGVDYGILNKSGAFYSYGDTRLGQGRENAKGFLSRDTDMLQRLEADIRTAAEIACGGQDARCSGSDFPRTAGQ